MAFCVVLLVILFVTIKTIITFLKKFTSHLKTVELSVTQRIPTRSGLLRGCSVCIVWGVLHEKAVAECCSWQGPESWYHFPLPPGKQLSKAEISCDSRKGWKGSLKITQRTFTRNQKFLGYPWIVFGKTYILTSQIYNAKVSVCFGPFCLDSELVSSRSCRSTSEATTSVPRMKLCSWQGWFIKCASTMTAHSWQPSPKSWRSWFQTICSEQCHQMNGRR